MAKKRSNKYYAVVKGRKPGIYTQWYGEEGAEIQVRGFPGAVFKGFTSMQGARNFFKTPPTVVRPVPGKTKTAGKKRPSDGEKTGDVVLYTDGGCINNPGPGGYGAVIEDRRSGKTVELSGGFRLTTNNRMELLACIVGLETLSSPSSVTLYSDSRYVVNGITKGWAARWRANGWKRTATEKALNADLWGRLLDLCEWHDVQFQWVKGHAGNRGNERCDRLANTAARQNKLPADTVYEKAVMKGEYA